MAKQTRTIVKEITAELNTLFGSEKEINGIWEKYVKFGDLSSVTLKKDKTLHFHFETKGYGDYHGNDGTFKRLTDAEYNKQRPEWKYNWRGEKDITLTNAYVMEMVARRIEREGGKVKAVTYSVYAD